MANTASSEYVLDACRKDLVGLRFIETVKSVLQKSSEGAIQAAYLNIISALAAHGESFPGSRK